MSKKSNHVSIDEKLLVTYIHVGDTTIAVATGTPFGISSKAPEDKYDDEIGRSLAFNRLVNDAYWKGKLEIK